MEGLFLDYQLLDKVCLINGVGSAEEEECVLGLEGEEGGERGGVGGEGDVVAVILHGFPLLAVVVEPLGVNLLDLGVDGEPAEDVHAALVQTGRRLGALDVEVAQLRPLPILNAVNFCLLEVAALLAVASHREHHLPVLVVEQAVA